MVKYTLKINCKWNSQCLKKKQKKTKENEKKKKKKKFNRSVHSVIIVAVFPNYEWTMELRSSTERFPWCEAVLPGRCSTEQGEISRHETKHNWINR